MKRFIASWLIFLTAYLVVDCTFAEAVSVALSVYVFLAFVHQIGEQIALLECIGVIASLEILLIPAVTYQVLPASMPVESSYYFSFALPAYIAFYGGLNWFSRKQLAHSHQEYIQAASRYLGDKQITSFGLLIIGLIGFLVKKIYAEAPYALSSLPYYCLFISALYAYYSGSKRRGVVIALSGFLLLTNAVQTGMFGELFFWIMLLTLVVAAGQSVQITTRLKTVLVLSAFALLLLIQSIKGEYRWHTWGYYRNERSSDAMLMVDLLMDRVSNPEKILTVDQIYLSFVRFNQGIMIGNAMAKVPVYEAYANGEVLLSLLYPFVPRLLWPGKPQTGGYENIRRFTTLPQFENTSINLSPVGEGYVNFGYGGILFALFYGILLSSVFQYVVCLAERTPTVILWLPVLYVGSLTMETDLLSTWGGLVNSAIFISLLFWLLKRLGVQL
jgi:hypothetical protein